MTRIDYQRTRARIIRAGSDTTHLSIPAWCQGQITVPVQTLNLITVTGLSREDLIGAELTITANLAAVTDTEVDPHAFEAEQSDGRPSAQVRSLSIAA